MDLSRDSFTNKGSSSLLYYTPKSQMDYGTVLCVASNVVGRQIVPCIYHVIPAGDYNSIFFWSENENLWIFFVYLEQQVRFITWLVNWLHAESIIAICLQCNVKSKKNIFICIDFLLCNCEWQYFDFWPNLLVMISIINLTCCSKYPLL